MTDKVQWTHVQELVYHLDDEGRVVKKEAPYGEVLEEITYTKDMTIVSKSDGTEIRKYFDENGHLVKKEKYVNGILKKIARYIPQDNNTVIKRVTSFK